MIVCRGGERAGMTTAKRSRHPKTVPVPTAADTASSSGSPFPPIGDYAFLSDCHVNALVASGGSVEWFCTPRPDSPSVFASMLDRGAGSFRVAPESQFIPAGRRYIPG